MKNHTTIQRLVKSLCKTLRKEVLSKFRAPLTGRITEIVPFLTFSDAEQTAVAHKYMTELGKDLAKPVVISPNETRQRLAGDIELQVPKDYSVCRAIAKEDYMEQLGPRSVIHGVNKIESEVLEQSLEMHGEIEEGKDVATHRVEVNTDDGIEICPIRPSTTTAGITAGRERP